MGVLLIMISEFACGNGTTLCLTVTGEVFGWGRNLRGLLGDHSDSRECVSTPKLISLPHTIQQISCGKTHAGALDKNGKLWTWGQHIICGGDNDEPKKSQGYAPRVIFPTESFSQLHCGKKFSFALTSNYEAKIWGSIQFSEVPDSSFEKIAASSNIFLGIEKDSNFLWTWAKSSGSKLLNLPELCDSLPAVIKVSCGKNFVVAIAENGSVWSWGDNQFGQLGMNTRDTTPSRTPIDISSYFECEMVDIHCGAEFAVGVDAKHSSYSWGRNSSGELGIGKLSECQERPIRIAVNPKSSNPPRFFCGDNYVFMIDSNGECFCWGSNFYCQLGFENPIRDHYTIPLPQQFCLETSVVPHNSRNSTPNNNSPIPEPIFDTEPSTPKKSTATSAETLLHRARGSPVVKAPNYSKKSSYSPSDIQWSEFVKSLRDNENSWNVLQNELPIMNQFNMEQFVMDNADLDWTEVAIRIQNEIDALECQMDSDATEDDQVSVSTTTLALVEQINADLDKLKSAHQSTWSAKILDDSLGLLSKIEKDSLQSQIRMETLDMTQWDEPVIAVFFKASGLEDYFQAVMAVLQQHNAVPKLTNLTEKNITDIFGDSLANYKLFHYYRDLVRHKQFPLSKHRLDCPVCLNEQQIKKCLLEKGCKSFASLVGPYKITGPVLIRITKNELQTLLPAIEALCVNALALALRAECSLCKPTRSTT